MALPTNTRESRTLVKMREEVIQTIMRTEPEETPVFSGMQRKSTRALKSQYMRDSLRAPNKDNAAMEGDLAGDARATTQPQMLEGSVQIYKDVIGTSETTLAVDLHGRSNEHEFQIGKAMLELKRDAEATAISLNVAQERTALLPPKTAGIAAHIFTNASVGVGGSVAAHTSGLPTTAIVPGTNRTFTADILEAQMQAIYTSSGETPPVAFMSPRHKVAASQFTGLSHIREDSNLGSNKEATIFRGADTYVSNFGAITFVPHYMLSTANHILMLSQKYNDAVFLRGFSKKRLGPRGDLIEDLITAEVGFRVRAEKTQGVIHALT